MNSHTLAAEPHEDFIATVMRQLEAHGGGHQPALILLPPLRARSDGGALEPRRHPRPEPTPPCAAGLYRQEKLLMRSDCVEKLEIIKKAFLKRKADWQTPMALADIINASVAFVLRHVDFESLESVEDLDLHIASRLDPKGSRL